MNLKSLPLGRNKKGSPRDLILIMILIFAFAVTLIVILPMTHQLNDALIPALNNTYANESLTQIEDVYDASFDYISVLYLVGLLLFFFTAAFYLDAPAVFAVVWIIIMMVAVVIAIPLQDTYYQMAWNTTALNIDGSAPGNSFTVTNYIVGENLTTFIFLIGLIAIIAFYAKNRLGGGGAM